MDICPITLKLLTKRRKNMSGRRGLDRYPFWQENTVKMLQHCWRYSNWEKCPNLNLNLWGRIWCICKRLWEESMRRSIWSKSIWGLFRGNFRIFFRGPSWNLQLLLGRPRWLIQSITAKRHKLIFRGCWLRRTGSTILFT